MISVDVKLNVKQKEMKELVVVSCKFLLEIPSKPKYNVKEACNFHLILAGIPSPA